MEVVVKCNKKVLFKELRSGDVFKEEEIGSYYMKIYDIENNDEMCNCVNLTDGKCEYMYPGSLVIKVNCKLVVE